MNDMLFLEMFRVVWMDAFVFDLFLAGVFGIVPLLIAFPLRLVSCKNRNDVFNQRCSG